MNFLSFYSRRSAPLPRRVFQAFLKLLRPVTCMPLSRPLGFLTSALLLASVLHAQSTYTFTALGYGFNQPNDVAIDSKGNVYVTDELNNALKVIDHSGNITILRGGLSLPAGLARDSSGNIYIADSGSSTIVKIASNGPSSTYATGFFGPLGLAIDGNGNVYVADTLHNLVRKIASDGVTITTLGSGFNAPKGITVDGSGNVYVADTNNSAVKKIASDGVTVTTLGSGFVSPQGVAVDAHGNVYVADTNIPTIMKISSDGVTVTSVGGSFNFPRGVALDPGGNLYVADQHSSMIYWGATAVPAQTSPTSASGVAGQAFSYTSVFSGTFANYGATNLPPGLSVDLATGVISGIPTSAGSTVVALSAINGAGTGSGSLTITVTSTDVPPAIVTGPSARSVDLGDATTLGVTASGTNLTYQWYLNGIALPGANSASYSIAAARATDAGNYTVTVSNMAGSVTSDTANLTVTSPVPGHLVNLSVRTGAGTGAQTLIAGFVIMGANKSMLIRGIGPALIPYGVADALPDPALNIYLSGTSAPVYSNAGWGSVNATTTTALNAAFAAIGAFSLPDSTSKDSALLVSLAPGAYTAQITGRSGDTGIALAELYDDDGSAAAGQLINASARAQVGTGNGILIAGFVISGNTNKTVLIRGIGPALTAYGVAGALPDPELDIYRSGASSPIYTNTGWGNGGSATTASLTSAFTSTGAFQLTDPTSKDSALLISLPPGVYTAQVKGASGDTGVALIEVYAVP